MGDDYGTATATFVKRFSPRHEPLYQRTAIAIPPARPKQAGGFTLTVRAATRHPPHASWALGPFATAVP